MNDPLPLERETYLAERRALVESENEQARLYDRTILTLSGGALALSLTFVHDIASHLDRATFPLLYAAWGGFIVSLLATLTSFQVAQSAMRHQREIVDALHTSDPAEATPIRNYFAKWTNILNWTSLVSFIMGAILMAVFVGMNVRG